MMYELLYMHLIIILISFIAPKIKKQTLYIEHDICLSSYHYYCITGVDTSSVIWFCFGQSLDIGCIFISDFLYVLYCSCETVGRDTQPV